MHFVYVALTFVGSAVAAPAPTTTTTTPYPTPTFTCATGLKAQLAHFDDLAIGGSLTHPVRPSPAPYAGVYKNLYYGYYDWQVITGGVNSSQPIQVQSLQDGGATDPSYGNFNMSAHSGRNAIMAGSQAHVAFTTYYGGNYLNLKEFWARSEKANTALPITYSCYVYPPTGSSHAVTYTATLPAKPLGVYSQIKLTAAQQTAVQYAHSCYIAATDSISRVMIDDIGYCFYLASGNPV